MSFETNNSDLNSDFVKTVDQSDIFSSLSKRNSLTYRKSTSIDLSLSQNIVNDDINKDKDVNAEIMDEYIDIDKQLNPIDSHIDSSLLNQSNDSENINRHISIDEASESVPEGTSYYILDSKELETDILLIKNKIKENHVITNTIEKENQYLKTIHSLILEFNTIQSQFNQISSCSLSLDIIQYYNKLVLFLSELKQSPYIIPNYYHRSLVPFSVPISPFEVLQQSPVLTNVPLLNNQSSAYNSINNQVKLNSKNTKNRMNKTINSVSPSNSSFNHKYPSTSINNQKNKNSTSPRKIRSVPIIGIQVPKNNEDCNDDNNIDYISLNNNNQTITSEELHYYINMLLQLSTQLLLQIIQRKYDTLKHLRSEEQIVFNNDTSKKQFENTISVWFHEIESSKQLSICLTTLIQQCKSNMKNIGLYIYSSS